MIQVSFPEQDLGIGISQKVHKLLRTVLRRKFFLVDQGTSGMRHLKENLKWLVCASHRGRGSQLYTSLQPSNLMRTNFKSSGIIKNGTVTLYLILSSTRVTIRNDWANFG